MLAAKQSGCVFWPFPLITAWPIYCLTKLGSYRAHDFLVTFVFDLEIESRFEDVSFSALWIDFWPYRHMNSN